MPIRREPTERVKYVVEGGGGPRGRALPSGRALASFLDPNTVTRAIEDLGRSGYRPLAAPSDSA
jgi:DNA-binding transcriptional regulator YhcF (GntR family)